VQGDGSGGDSIYGGKVGGALRCMYCPLLPFLPSNRHIAALPGVPSLHCHHPLLCPSLQFKDEPAALKLKHDAAGVVGFANSGKKGQILLQWWAEVACVPMGSLPLTQCVSKSIGVSASRTCRQAQQHLSVLHHLCGGATVRSEACCGGQGGAGT
jgi:hypothetical protein